jgi:hydroxymethylbilane synthase
MKQVIKIGTRESQLAVWQASLVQNLLKEKGFDSELIYIKSEGDIDIVTPLYELGVQGIFTKTLDAALLNKRIDIAVHSMKDVPTQMAQGIKLGAVLKRASYNDVLIFKGERKRIEEHLSGKKMFENSSFTVATSSVRRKAQWLNKYPADRIENLRGNVNTRLRKIGENEWDGAIFAAAGVERINLRPENSIDLDWMLPAPAQGAIAIACRDEDRYAFETSHLLNHEPTAISTRIERDFLRTLSGGCSTPISALAVIDQHKILFKGNLCSVDGKQKLEIEKVAAVEDAGQLGIMAGEEMLENEQARKIISEIKNGK